MAGLSGRLQRIVDDLVLECKQGDGERADRTRAELIAIFLSERVPVDLCNAALKKFERAFNNRPLRHGPILFASSCLLVENGGKPEIILPSLSCYLRDAVGYSLDFVNLSVERQAKTSDDLTNEFVDEHYREYYSWRVVGLLAQSFTLLLSSAPITRAGAKQDLVLGSSLRKLLRALRENIVPYKEDNELHLRYLQLVLGVLDGDDLVVVHIDQKKGFRVRLYGIAHVAQLTTLLADALIGDPKNSWLKGKRPDPRVVAAAKDQPIDPSHSQFEAPFRVMDWSAYRRDGMVDQSRRLDLLTAPGDIPLFAGERIVLLSRTHFAEKWCAQRVLGRLAARIEVLAKLSESEVQQYLKRITNCDAENP